MSISRRLRKELQLWRMTWQQVETFLDRLEGVRQDDAEDAWTAAVCYEGLDQVEALRARRSGYRLARGTPFATPSAVPDADDAPTAPLPWDPGTPRPSSLATGFAAWNRHLPDALDVELAAAPLQVNEEGKVGDPPKARLIATEAVLTVYSEAARNFVTVYAPHYGFGRYEPAAQAAHPFLAALVPLTSTQIEIGEDNDETASEETDVGLYSLPRRRMAADEGFAPIRKWRDEHERRRADLAETEDDWEASRQTTPFITDVLDALASGDLSTPRTAMITWRAEANTGRQHLISVRRRVEHEELDDALIDALDGLAEQLATESSSLTAIIEALDDGEDPNIVALGLMFLPTPDGPRTRPHVDVLRQGIDAALAARLTVPDGSIRQVRTLETGLLRFWRARKHWFPHRQVWVYQPLKLRFLRSFEDALSGLLAGQATVPAGWEQETVARAAAASTAELIITAKPGSRRLRRQRPGRLALIGGARPSAAIVLRGGRHPNAAGGQQLKLDLLPLHISLQSAQGLDGIPGLVQAGSPLIRSGRVLDGASLVRGRFGGEPEADGLLHAAVALWGQLALLQGAASTPALPAPFDPGLRLPVQATSTAPLSAGAPLLVLPTAFAAGFADALGPKLGSPGERFLLTGRTADGAFVRGVVQVAQAVVTSLQALEITPETNPTSPIRCTADTAVVALQLVDNGVRDELVGDVWLTRDFLGFGTSLAIGTQLPTELDASTQLQVIPSQHSVSFLPRPPTNPLDTGHPPQWVDRGAELAEAARTLEHWVGRA